MKKETKIYIEVTRRYNKIVKIISSCNTLKQLATMENFIYSFERRTMKEFLPFRSIGIITLELRLQKLLYLKGLAIIAQGGLRELDKILQK